MTAGTVLGRVQLLCICFGFVCLFILFLPSVVIFWYHAFISNDVSSFAFPLLSNKRIQMYIRMYHVGSDLIKHTQTPHRHTDTQTHTHTYIYIYIYIYCRYVYVYIYIYIHIYIYIYVYICIYICIRHGPSGPAGASVTAGNGCWPCSVAMHWFFVVCLFALFIPSLVVLWYHAFISNDVFSFVFFPLLANKRIQMYIRMCHTGSDLIKHT